MAPVEHLRSHICPTHLAHRISVGAEQPVLRRSRPPPAGFRRTLPGRLHRRNRPERPTRPGTSRQCMSQLKIKAWGFRFSCQLLRPCYIGKGPIHQPRTGGCSFDLPRPNAMRTYGARSSGKPHTHQVLDSRRRHAGPDKCPDAGQRLRLRLYGKRMRRTAPLDPLPGRQVDIPSYDSRAPEYRTMNGR